MIAQDLNICSPCHDMCGTLVAMYMYSIVSSAELKLRNCTENWHVNELKIHDISVVCFDFCNVTSLPIRIKVGMTTHGLPSVVSSIFR